MKSVKEVNELINQRKSLQIEAYRLTQIFKTKVNTMAQKEVEDIFAKSMQANKFKASSTLKLAKTFLQKHKIMQNQDDDETHITESKIDSPARTQKRISTKKYRNNQVGFNEKIEEIKERSSGFVSEKED